MQIGRVSVDKYNYLGLGRSGADINEVLRKKAASIGGDAAISLSEDFANIYGVVVKMK